MAFRLAETVRLPVMVNYDGFYLSHTYEAAAIPEQKNVDLFLPPPPDRPAVDPENPENRHGLVGSEAMHRLLNVRYQATEAVPGIYEEVNHDFNKHMGRSWPAVDCFGPEGAPTVLVTAGAMAQTVKSFLAGPGRGEALLKIRMFRPFPAEAVRKVLGAPHIKKIVVIDRNISMGAGGIFAQEIKAALQELPCSPQVNELNVSGGLDLTPDMLARALDTEPEAGEKISWAVNLI
jgi:pyruvate/2-oxoacid:ferredoxin oxidoreductase alpha subunit